MKHESKFSRRQFVAGAATIAGSAAVLQKLTAQVQTPASDQTAGSNALVKTESNSPPQNLPPGEPGKDYNP